MKLAAITDVDLAHPGIVSTARLESLLRIGDSRSASVNSVDVSMSNMVDPKLWSAAFQVL